ncbi:hypothetical protein [Xanthomonas translucens]|uniref:hypothetical protein n=1 Tax=Xanthomonas campestris pv. translucens TaxID=343 RepID=UPI000B24B971|nr:hypothetical protein [Xanthomonas translucens]UKE57741.1 hypothetical protein KFS86_17305 [Xanthomonas translucens pv. hordei]WIH00749.1 hypothetical protein KFS83_17305 [Xanthomonas translucens pv. hordei]
MQDRNKRMEVKNSEIGQLIQTANIENQQINYGQATPSPSLEELEIEYLVVKEVLRKARICDSLFISAWAVVCLFCLTVLRKAPTSPGMITQVVQLSFLIAIPITSWLLMPPIFREKYAQARAMIKSEEKKQAELATLIEKAKVRRKFEAAG